MKHIFMTFIMFILCTGCQQKHDQENFSKPVFQKFNGVHVGEGGYVLTSNQKMDNRKKADLIAVLVYYGIPVRYENSQILIPDSCFADMNYLYNMTIKSTDSIWFMEHIMPK
jgi:hypothetical protein